MADPMTANPQQTRLIVTSRLLGELTAQQTQIVRLLRSLRLGQSNPSGDQQWKPPGRTNGHRTPCAGSAAAMPDARVVLEVALPHPTKRDYNYFTELERRLAELSDPPVPSPAGGKRANGHQ